MANKHTLSPQSRWEEATDLLAAVVVRVLVEKPANYSLDYQRVPSMHDSTTNTRVPHARADFSKGGRSPDNVRQ
jgi:hypothetical protein